MKVALIIERVEVWRGGAETSTVQFAGHLARLGCRVDVLTTTYMPSTPDLTIVPIRASARLRGSRMLAFVQRVERHVRREAYDVVHSIVPCRVADIYQPRGGTVPEMLERNLAIRTTSLSRELKRVAQGLNLKYRVIRRLERQLLTRRPPPYVISISRYVTDQLRRHYGIEGAHVREIFNGVEPDETPPAERLRHRAEIRGQYGLQESDLVLLCVAHNFKLKGVDRLIEACALRRGKGEIGSAGSQPGRTFALIAGRDNPRESARLADRLGLTDRVIFAGPTKRMAAFFHAADVLVHPTYYDPCSRVVLEAMAAGLPVITTRYNGAAECITDGQEGYTIDEPTDIDDLAERIDRLADADHRRACAVAAPKAVQTVTMRAHAEQVLALYEELLSRGELKQGGYR